MPLYMDLHRIPSITIEEAKKAHVADEAIQSRYGVKYLQFWCNEQAGSLFCLVEGPDKKTVEEVHGLAHGHVACAVVEVDPSYYALIMGNNILIDEGVVRDRSGVVDLGYRSIMVVALREMQEELTGGARTLVHEEISKYQGRHIELAGDDRTAGVFNSASQALHCSLKIAKEFSKNRNLSFSIGLSAGEPVTEGSTGFIESAIRTAKNLCYLADDGKILMSSLADELSAEDIDHKKKNKVRALTTVEETFLSGLFNIIDKRLFDEDFTIESLVKDVGISRPQLYRKIHALSGKSPNNLIRDLRLEKAMSMLRRKTGNVSEIAFKVGFNNPSYFAKCFSEKFGKLPSEVSL
jgi:AraC-like DNA-binding protein